MNDEVERQPAAGGVVGAHGVGAGLVAEAAFDVVVGVLADREILKVGTLDDDPRPCPASAGWSAPRSSCGAVGWVAAIDGHVSDRLSRQRAWRRRQKLPQPIAGYARRVSAYEPDSTPIGWVGTGVMGTSMCGHLLAGGYPVTVYSRTRGRAESLLQRGATWADSPAQLAARSEVVFTMVGYPADVREVMLGDDGVLSTIRPGGVIVDMTTSEPSLARELFDAGEATRRRQRRCPRLGRRRRRAQRRAVDHGRR